MSDYDWLELDAPKHSAQGQEAEEKEIFLNFFEKKKIISEASLIKLRVYISRAVQK